MDLADQLAQREELMKKAQALHPLLKKNAEQADQERIMPDESFNALVEAGMLKLCTPRRYGGLEVGHRTYLDVVAELARSTEASGSWYGFILNMTDWIVGMMSAEAQDAVWGDSPDTVTCCPLNPAPGWSAVWEKNGDLILSGEWGYTSGCMHAQWALPGLPVLNEAGEAVDAAVALVPMTEIDIKDTWHVIGMRGTGSNTLVLNEVRVPAERIMRMSGPVTNNFPTPYKNEYMYHADVAATFWTCVHPTVLGLAQAGLDVTVDRMANGSKKPITYTLYTDATKAPSTQFSLAQAETLIDAATLQARAAADTIDAQSRTGEFLPKHERHRQIMRSANVVRQCREAIDHLMDVQGAGSFASSNPMNRIWRDLCFASRHGFNAAGVKHEIFGRSLLNADEQQMTAFL